MVVSVYIHLHMCIPISFSILCVFYHCIGILATDVRKAEIRIQFKNEVLPFGTAVLKWHISVSNVRVSHLDFNLILDVNEPALTLVFNRLNPITALVGDLGQT